jgi:hypothetical protein
LHLFRTERQRQANKTEARAAIETLNPDDDDGKWRRAFDDDDTEAARK